MKQRISQLEYHVLDACNFSCKFCAHYSDLHRSSKRVKLEDAIQEWLLWSSRIVPQVFWILGGEPTIHKDLCSLIVAAKLIWKDSVIGVVTNGTLLERHYAIGQLLAGNRLAVSMHGTREEEILSNARKTGHPSVEIRQSEANWQQWYKIVDGKFQPFEDGDQRSSWKNCNASQCKILRDGKLWKCPQVALAKGVGIDWFDGYSPCSVEDDIAAWVAREDEACCANCPSTS